jgi:hypothetical protein
MMIVPLLKFKLFSVKLPHTLKVPPFIAIPPDHTAVPPVNQNVCPLLIVTPLLPAPFPPEQAEAAGGAGAHWDFVARLIHIK